MNNIGCIHLIFRNNESIGFIPKEFSHFFLEKITYTICGDGDKYMEYGDAGSLTFCLRKDKGYDGLKDCKTIFERIKLNDIIGVEIVCENGETKAVNVPFEGEEKNKIQYCLEEEGKLSVRIGSLGS